MRSLRALADRQLKPPAKQGVRDLAQRVGIAPPFSLAAVLDALAQPVTFHGDIRTPPGTALGGTTDLTLFPDGTTRFVVHMHDSGFDPYTFQIRCAVQAPSGLTVLFQVDGHTDGTGSDLFGSPDRDFDHDEQKPVDLVELYWLDVRASVMAVSKSYDDAGALHALEQIAKDLLGFLVADLTLGVGLALVVVASAALADSLDVSVGTGGLVGVLVAGGVAWVWGPSAIIASVVAGFAAGAITDALIRNRLLTEEEYRFATVVFGDTLPPRTSIFVTNLSHDTGRSYTWPSVDGSVLLNINTAFDDPLGTATPGYPTRGQLLVHELAHAWQIHTHDFTPGLICQRLSGTASYTVPPAGQGWGDYGMEQQATIVDTWFHEHGDGWTTIEDLATKLGQPDAVNDAYFTYIRHHIRAGMT